MGRRHWWLGSFAVPVAPLFLFLSSPVSVQGQESITLERVIALARERAPAIAGAQARVIQAEGRKYASSVPPDPAVTGGIGRGRPTAEAGSGRETSIAVQQFLPSPRSTQAWIRSGDADIQAARDDVEAVTGDVVLEARRLFYQAAVADAQSRALEEAAVDARSLRDVVSRRVELGEASEGDRLRTQVESLRTELEARTARAEAEAAKAVLNRFLLDALGDTFSLAADLDPSRLPPPPPNLLELALQGNPEYRAARDRIEAGRWALSAQQRSRLPGLALSFFRDNEIDKTSTGLTLGITVPLWNRNQGAVRAAQGELAELESSAVELRARIQAEVERLILAERAAREAAISYRSEILPAATQALSIVRFSLDQGEANLLAWLDARRSFIEILRASHRAQLEAFLRRAELARLAGVVDVH